MRPTAPDQSQHQHQDQQHREQLEQPKCAPLERADDNIHTNMAAIALHIGDPHKGNQGHGLFNPVNIARQRRIHRVAAPYGHNSQQHKRKDSQPADERKQLLQL